MDKKIFLQHKMRKLVLVLLLLVGYSLSAQNQYEREYRILKSQFPDNALALIQNKLEEVKKLKFYKESDSAKISYKAKFKKDRLHYSATFDTEGALENIRMNIKKVDLPEDAFAGISAYLEQYFSKHRIRKMQQEYVAGDNNVETTLKNAFQNLILPSIKYKFLVSGKKNGAKAKYELSFNADGKFESIRKSPPPNYDHVLY